MSPTLAVPSAAATNAAATRPAATVPATTRPTSSDATPPPSASTPPSLQEPQAQPAALLGQHASPAETTGPAGASASAPASAPAPAPPPIDADALLPGVQRRLAEALGPRRYDLTFTHTAHLSVRAPADPDGAAAVRAVVPGRFFAQRLRNDYADALRDAVNAELGRPADAPVALTVHEDPAQFPDAASSRRTGAKAGTGPGTEPDAGKNPRSAAGSAASSVAGSAASSSRAGTAGGGRPHAVRGAGSPGARARPGLPGRSGTLARRPGQCRGFDAFVVGPSNRMAHAAARALASPGHGGFDAPAAAVGIGAGAGAGAGAEIGIAIRGDEAYDGPAVLVLHGDCGLGKTHLLLAACQRAQEQQPDARVRYLTGEQFVNQFIEAVRTNTLKTFRAALRRLDLLAIDDVQFLANKTKSQQEFLHCFDHIEQSGARVIMATDQHPRDLPAFSAPLVSRCVKGLVVEVRAPDAATRLELVDRLARRRGLALRPGVAEVVSQHAGTSVRELEGAVTRLQAVVSLVPRPGARSGREGSGAASGGGLRVPRTVSLHDAAELAALDRSGARTRAPRPVRFDEVLAAVTAGMNVAREQIVAGSRQREVVLARGLLVHLARELTTLSYPEMARALNKRSHSTLVSSRGRFKTLLEADAPLLLSGHGGAVTPSQLVERLRAAVLAD